MPLRLLSYITRIYEKITAGKKRQWYGKKGFTLPRPEFIVLYNGVDPFPEKKTIRLSDLFEDLSALGLPSGPPDLELVAKVFNINQGHNEGIAERCEKLRGYSAFIAKVREEEAAKGAPEGAMEGGIRWCIGEGILKEFFESHGTEVVNMLMTEWKLEDALAVEREEGLEEGWEKGLEQTARNALARGFSIDVIREITGLDEGTIARLSQN